MLEIGGFDPLMPALIDWECVLRLARIGPINLTDEPLVRQRFSGNSITRSARNRVLARERIVEKNHDLLTARPALLAQHHHAISGGWRRLGDLPRARMQMRLALAACPRGQWRQKARYQAIALALAALDLRGRLIR